MPEAVASTAAAVVWERLTSLADRFVPDAGRTDGEVRRRAQLFVTFSALGAVFGGLFAAFYFAIGHPWGGAIVAACTLTMVAAPWIVRAAGLVAAGNVYALVLVLGFSGLTAIEGGLHGHAVAWLAVVPLCASILVDQQLGRWWCAVCLGVVAAFCGLDFAGRTPPAFYPAQWDKAITAAGYVSLTLFMSAVGLLFERGRRHALAKLHAALDALSAANVRLKVLDRERAEFLGIAAHDLRSPLNTIIGFAQLVGRYDPDATPTQIDAMDTIIRSSEHMRDLLNRFLSIRAIEEGRLEIRIESCDLHGTAMLVVDGYRSKAREKGLSLTFEPVAATNPYVMADQQSLQQIIDNLVSNAIKFSPRGRPVTVRVRLAEHGGTATIEVQDAGPGLSEEDQRELYGKFARLSARPTGGEASSGLGLSIVKRLAEAMGGELACRSRLGEGATFSLTLPIGAAPAPDGAGEAASRSSGPPTGPPATPAVARLRV